MVEKWRGVVAGAVLREGWGEGGAAFLGVRTPSSGDMSDAFVILRSSTRACASRATCSSPHRPRSKVAKKGPVAVTVHLSHPR
jgi:hypothetical protein